MTQPALGPGAEFDLIRRIATELGSTAVGLGDDCALVAMGHEFLAISTDTSVEGTHFRREWLTLPEIGWKAAAAALSDLAAVGATTPRVLAAITTPVPGEAAGLMRGVGEVVASVGGQIIGGDLTRGDVLSLTVTVLGTVVHPIRRSGARPGDGLWVTGSLGLARAALRGWQSGEEPGAAAREGFARPRPRIAAGEWLAQHGATAMLDLSDGLAGDSRHLAAASRCDLTIELERVPVGAAVTSAAKRDNADATSFAAQGGEDYELLVALPPDFTAASEFAKATGIALSRIGRCLEAGSAGPQARLTVGGEAIKLAGYDHFR